MTKLYKMNFSITHDQAYLKGEEYILFPIIINIWIIIIKYILLYIYVYLIYSIFKIYVYFLYTIYSISYIQYTIYNIYIYFIYILYLLYIHIYYKYRVIINFLNTLAVTSVLNLASIKKMIFVKYIIYNTVQIIIHFYIRISDSVSEHAYKIL